MSESWSILFEYFFFSMQYFPMKLLQKLILGWQPERSWVLSMIRLRLGLVKRMNGSGKKWLMMILSSERESQRRQENKKTIGRRSEVIDPECKAVVARISLQKLHLALRWLREM